MRPIDYGDENTMSEQKTIADYLKGKPSAMKNMKMIKELYAMILMLAKDFNDLEKELRIEAKMVKKTKVPNTT